MTPSRFQPIPYQGSKRSLAPRIARFFPKSVDVLYEPFAGSAAMSLFAASHGLAKRFVIGDAQRELIELWKLVVSDPTKTADLYRVLWEDQFRHGAEHFNAVRTAFNENRDPILLLYLTARCVKNAVRYNRHGQFTQSVDKRRTGTKPDRMERSIHWASGLLRGKVEFFSGDFGDCLSGARPVDLAYMDPPYQGTTYGTDKRYAQQVTRERVTDVLRELNARGVPFILSYDGKTGEKTYGERLPIDAAPNHIELSAGASTQATLTGRPAETIESLYVSEFLSTERAKTPMPPKTQLTLFAQ